MWLVIKALHPGRMGNLKAHFWMFDIDMRRIFIRYKKKSDFICLTERSLSYDGNFKFLFIYTEGIVVPPLHMSGAGNKFSFKIENRKRGWGEID